MIHPFVCEGDRTGDTCFVVVVYGDVVEGIRYAKILGTEFDMEELLGAFVGGHDFGFVGALDGLFLSDGDPGDGAAVATDEVAREGPIFEKFEKGSV